MDPQLIAYALLMVALIGLVLFLRHSWNNTAAKKYQRLRSTERSRARAREALRQSRPRP